MADQFGSPYGGYINVPGLDPGDVTAVNDEIDKFIGLIPTAEQISTAITTPATITSAKSLVAPDFDEITPKLAVQYREELSAMQAGIAGLLPTIAPTTVPQTERSDPPGADKFGAEPNGYGDYVNVTVLTGGEVILVEAEIEKFRQLIPTADQISTAITTPATITSGTAGIPPDFDEITPKLAQQLRAELGFLSLAIANLL